VSGSPDAAELPAYGDGAAWAGGPQLVYDRLAAAALCRLPDRLDGLVALDAGAGTGAATRELLRRGARVVAVDRSNSMLAELARQTGHRVPTVVSDIRSLALSDDAYDVAVAAFVLNHLADPAGAVRDLRRVTRPGGVVLATTFTADDHPIKAAVDDGLGRHGFVPPPWYRTLKRERMPLTATPAALAAVGRHAGLAEVTVDETHVALGDLPPAAAIGYRLGLAHIAPFMATLDDTERARLGAELADAVAALPPLRLSVLVLSGRA
jgi:SAM-dependent methyltransferase